MANSHNRRLNMITALITIVWNAKPSVGKNLHDTNKRWTISQNSEGKN